MTIRERTTQTYTDGSWDAMCQDCPWYHAGMTRRSLFRGARQHVAETGHTVAIGHDQEWTITRKEEHEDVQAPAE